MDVHYYICDAFDVLPSVIVLVASDCSLISSKTASEEGLVPLPSFSSLPASSRSTSLSWLYWLSWGSFSIWFSIAAFNPSNHSASYRLPFCNHLSRKQYRDIAYLNPIYLSYESYQVVLFFVDPMAVLQLMDYQNSCPTSSR